MNNCNHDPEQMRSMLMAMQSGEMTVSRGLELLEIWLAGNYREDMLPPIENILPDDQMPWDVIKSLLATADELILADMQPYPSFEAGGGSPAAMVKQTLWR